MWSGTRRRGETLPRRNGGFLLTFEVFSSSLILQNVNYILKKKQKTAPRRGNVNSARLVTLERHATTRPHG